MSHLPSIHNLHSRKPLKTISFDVSRGGNVSIGKKQAKLEENESYVRSHGNVKSKEKTPWSFGEITGNLETNELNKLHKTQKDCEVETAMNGGKVVFSHIVQNAEPSDKSKTGQKSNGVDNEQLTKIIREKDREISRLREIIRKASLDREHAACADAHSRLRVHELKHKLSDQQRHAQRVTSVERLRCKEKVSNETERLREERDDARARVEHFEQLVWQLRKQVEQLGYLSRQRYKTIQELGRKMAAKDKSIQEMRKRMEQAQLIAIPGSSERRSSISHTSDTKSITWGETPSRLTTVNE